MPYVYGKGVMFSTVVHTGIILHHVDEYPLYTYLRSTKVMHYTVDCIMFKFNSVNVNTNIGVLVETSYNPVCT